SVLAVFFFALMVASTSASTFHITGVFGVTPFSGQSLAGTVEIVGGSVLDIDISVTSVAGHFSSLVTQSSGGNLHFFELGNDSNALLLGIYLLLSTPVLNSSYSGGPLYTGWYLDPN